MLLALGAAALPALPRHPHRINARERSRARERLYMPIDLGLAVEARHFAKILLSKAAAAMPNKMDRRDVFVVFVIMAFLSLCMDAPRREAAQIHDIWGIGHQRTRVSWWQVAGGPCRARPRRSYLRRSG